MGLRWAEFVFTKGISSFAPPPCTSWISSPQCSWNSSHMGCGLWVGGDPWDWRPFFSSVWERPMLSTLPHGFPESLLSSPTVPEHFSSFLSRLYTVPNAPSLLVCGFGYVIFHLSRWRCPVVHISYRGPWCSQPKWAFSHVTNFFIYEFVHVWNGVNRTIIIIHPVIVSAWWNSTSCRQCSSWCLERELEHGNGRRCDEWCCSLHTRIAAQKSWKPLRSIYSWSITLAHTKYKNSCSLVSRATCSIIIGSLTRGRWQKLRGWTWQSSAMKSLDFSLGMPPHSRKRGYCLYN